MLRTILSPSSPSGCWHRALPGICAPVVGDRKIHALAIRPQLHPHRPLPLGIGMLAGMAIKLVHDQTRGIDEARRSGDRFASTITLTRSDE